MKTHPLIRAAVMALLSTTAAQAALFHELDALTSFGGGDGWLAPAEGGISYLGTGNNERGLAYNSGTGNLVLVSRSGGLNIKLLDGATGADNGFLDQGTGIITGGTFAASMVGVGGDGAIYVGNLTVSSSTSAFKVYSWANEAATPTVAYSGDPIGGVGRFGDNLDVIGSGSATRIAVGAGNTTLTTDNSYAIIDPTAGTATYVGYAATAPAQGDFRLGVTFLDTDTVMGTQGGTWRVTDYAGADGTLLGSPATTSASERPMDYAMIAGVGYLATIDTASSLVRIYDMTDPLAPSLVASANNTSGDLTSNGNGVGAVAWGDITGSSATLYAMSANQGIQAFTFTAVPEPEEYAALAAGALVVFGLWRRFRR